MAMNLERIYMLASDHRWQWEEWCDAAGVARPRIAEVKQLIFEAFLAAREQSADVQTNGALLLDSTYGAAAVRAAQSAGIPVGTPVERAGVFPLEWQDEPFHTGLSGNSFAIGPSGRKVRRTGRCASCSSSRGGAGGSGCPSS
jgi:myo-inositol catabolism protein IolC